MTDLVVRPIRFTDEIDAMRSFFETLGLRPRVESVAGGWVDMVAHGGMVALHSARDSDRRAPSGLTALGFEADDVDALAERLIAMSVPDVTVYDESYGRVLSCRDPLGDVIAIDERSHDLYGYRLHEPAGVAADLRVMAVRYTDPRGAYGEFLDALGLRRRGEQDEHFTAYALGDGSHGLVGLHAPMHHAHPFEHEAGYVDLAFETTEALQQVADRLLSGGFKADLREESFGSVLTSVDGDGLTVEVHQASTG